MYDIHRPLTSRTDTGHANCTTVRLKTGLYPGVHGAPRERTGSIQNICQADSFRAMLESQPYRIIRNVTTRRPHVRNGRRNSYRIRTRARVHGYRSGPTWSQMQPNGTTERHIGHGSPPYHRSGEGTTRMRTIYAAVHVRTETVLQCLSITRPTNKTVCCSKLKPKLGEIRTNLAVTHIVTVTGTSGSLPVPHPQNWL